MNVHFIGKPCSGKGRLGEHLIEVLRQNGFPAFYAGTGAAVRFKIETDPAFARQFRAKIERRSLLDDGQLWTIVQELIVRNNIPLNDPDVVILWDCVLRNAAQTRRMSQEGILQPGDLVIYVEVTDATAKMKLQLRREEQHRTDDNTDAHDEGVRRFNASLHEVLGAIRESGATLVTVNANLPLEKWLANARKQMFDHFQAQGFTAQGTPVAA